MEPNIDNIVLNLLSISQFCSVQLAEAGGLLHLVGKNPINIKCVTNALNVSNGI